MGEEVGPGATAGAAEALRWARVLREVRSSVCEQLADRTVTIEDVMAARSDPRVGDVHLLLLLESLPGASKVSTRRRLADLGVAPRTRIADLDHGEVVSVLAEFGGTPGVERPTVPER